MCTGIWCTKLRAPCRELTHTNLRDVCAGAYPPVQRIEAMQPPPPPVTPGGLGVGAMGMAVGGVGVGGVAMGGMAGGLGQAAMVLGCVDKRVDH